MRKSWWLYVLLMVIAAVLFKDFGRDTFATLLVIMAIVSPILTIAQLYYFAVNPKNKIVFVPRKYQFTSEGISTEMDGKEGAVPLDYIVEVRELGKYWLLYISISQFFCIPKDAFYSETDHIEFKALVELIKKLK